MAIATLTAHERNDVAKKIRREGFTPGVVYGFGHEEGKSIQFKSSELLATVRKHGKNARVTVDIDGKGEYGAIKDIQLHPVTNEIRHIDIQVFGKDDIVRLTVPIHFTGADDLMVHRLVVGILMNEIEVTGPAIDIPQHITVDLSDKVGGDVVTVADLNISEELTTSAELTDTLVTISLAEEEPEEEETEEVDVEVEVIGEDDEDEE